MEVAEAVRAHLRLALRVGRLLPGAVDASGTGLDPALLAAVQREPLPIASDLVRDAGRLADALPAELGPQRTAFLRGQLTALEWTARRLAGQRVPFAQELAAVYDVRVRRGDEDAYAAAHRELDGLLPGRGPLADRMAEHRLRDRVPPEHLERALHALGGALRERTAATLGLPEGESVSFRVVDDAPWSALHAYRGGLRSVVAVNGGARPRRAQLAQLVAHEAYPGHHLQRCRTEVGPLARGWEEHAVAVTVSPQAVLAEGAAETGARVVLGDGWGRFAADVLSGVGLGFDGELAERVDAVTSRLARARLDAALMLHGEGAREEDVRAHLRRWLLVDDARAGQVLRFLRHPLWRGYTATYVEGAALVGRWWARDPRPARFARLLDEPLVPADVRREVAAAVPAATPERATTGPHRTTGGALAAMNGSPMR